MPPRNFVKLVLSLVISLSLMLIFGTRSSFADVFVVNTDVDIDTGGCEV